MSKNWLDFAHLKDRWLYHADFECQNDHVRNFSFDVVGFRVLQETLQCHFKTVKIINLKCN